MECVAEALVHVLRRAGIHAVFAIPGSLTDVLAYLDANGEMRLYTSTHEESLGYMALGYFAATGQPPAVVVTQGPGATNLVTATACAWRDRVPLVIITGHPPNRDRADFQDSSGRFHTPNVKSIFRPITQAQFLIDETHSGDVLQDLAHCLQTVSAPILVELPSPRAELTPCHPPPSVHEPERHDLRDVLDNIAPRPGEVFLLGEGCRGGPVAGLVAYAQRRGAHIATTMRAIDLVMTDTEGLLGNIGFSGKHDVNQFLSENCDQVVSFGASLNRLTTAGWLDSFQERGGRLFSVSLEEPAPLGIPLDRAFFLNLKYASMPDGKPQRSCDISSRADTSLLQLLDARDVPKTLVFEAFPGKIISTLVIGAGDRVITTASHGPIGCGVSLAMGSALARPERPHVVFCGDGGFVMSGMVLLTAARYQLPVLVIVLVNGEYRRVADAQRKKFGRAICADLVLPEFKSLAAAFRVRSASCQSRDELLQTVDRFMDNRQPTILAAPDILFA